MPVEVFVVMPKEQAEEEHGTACIEWELPDSYRAYFDMMKFPENLATVINQGWQIEIVFLKKDAKKVFDLLYPDTLTYDEVRVAEICEIVKTALTELGHFNLLNKLEHMFVSMI